MLLLPSILLSVKKQGHMTQKNTISALFSHDKPVQMTFLIFFSFGCDILPVAPLFSVLMCIFAFHDPPFSVLSSIT